MVINATVGLRAGAHDRRPARRGRSARGRGARGVPEPGRAAQLACARSTRRTGRRPRAWRGASSSRSRQSRRSWRPTSESTARPRGARQPAQDRPQVAGGGGQAAVGRGARATRLRAIELRVVRRRRRPPVPDRPQGRRAAASSSWSTPRRACSTTPSSTSSAVATCPTTPSSSAEKWQQAVSTVDWLTTQIPRDSRVPDLHLQRPSRRRSLPGTRRHSGSTPATARCSTRRSQRLRRRRARRRDQPVPARFGGDRALRPPPDNLDPARRRPADPGRARRPSGRRSRAEDRVKLFDEAVGRAARAACPSTSSCSRWRATRWRRSAFWKLALAIGRLVHEPVGGLAVRRAATRAALESFSLSFLDVICCGFGAIILLLVLTKIGEPRRARAVARRTSTALVARLQEELLRDPRRDQRARTAT